MMKRSKGRRQRIYEEPLSDLSDHRGLRVHLLVCSHLCLRVYLRLFLRVRACIRLQARDKLLQDATAQSATLKAGDEVVFDSRLLHAGTGNLPVAEGFFLSIFFNRGLAARSWGASKCAIRHVGPAMTVV